LGVSRHAEVVASTSVGNVDLSFFIIARADLGSVVVDVVSQDASEFRWEG
jgi:hypothetical protein